MRNLYPGIPSILCLCSQHVSSSWRSLHCTNLSTKFVCSWPMNRGYIMLRHEHVQFCDPKLETRRTCPERRGDENVRGCAHHHLPACLPQPLQPPSTSLSFPNISSTNPTNVFIPPSSSPLLNPFKILIPSASPFFCVHLPSLSSKPPRPLPRPLPLEPRPRNPPLRRRISSSGSGSMVAA